MHTTKHTHASAMSARYPSSSSSPVRPGDIATYVVTAVVVVLALAVLVVAMAVPHAILPCRQTALDLKDRAEAGVAPEAGPGVEQRTPDTDDALALVYAPWCTHCKRLVPVFDQLKQRGFRVALVDGSARGNEWLVANQVTHYPTVCVMRGDAVLKKYPSSGERTEDSIVHFYIEAGLPQPDPSLFVAAAAGTASTAVDDAAGPAAPAPAATQLPAAALPEVSAGV